MADVGHFFMIDCPNPVTKSAGYFTLDVMEGGSPPARTCVLMEPNTVCGTKYSMSAEFYNVYGYLRNEPNPTAVGHPGLVYNMQDHLNFDMVYFR